MTANHQKHPPSLKAHETFIDIPRSRARSEGAKQERQARASRLLRLHYLALFWATKGESCVKVKAEGACPRGPARAPPARGGRAPAAPSRHRQAGFHAYAKCCLSVCVCVCVCVCAYMCVCVCICVCVLRSIRRKCEDGARGEGAHGETTAVAGATVKKVSYHRPRQHSTAVDSKAASVEGYARSEARGNPLAMLAHECLPTSTTQNLAA